MQLILRDEITFYFSHLIVFVCVSFFQSDKDATSSLHSTSLCHFLGFLKNVGFTINEKCPAPVSI